MPSEWGAAPSDLDILSRERGAMPVESASPLRSRLVHLLGVAAIHDVVEIGPDHVVWRRAGVRRFDRALSIDSVNRWRAPVRMFAALRRVLRPRGLLGVGFHSCGTAGTLPEAILDLLHEGGFEVLAMEFGARGDQGPVCVIARPLMTARPLMLTPDPGSI